MDKNNPKFKVSNDFIISKTNINNFVVQGCPIRESEF